MSPVTVAHPSAPAFRRPTAVTVAAVLLSIAALLGACRGAGSGTATVAPTGTPPSSPSTGPTGSGDPTARPSGDLGPFACHLPVTGSATVDRAQLVNVRVGTHADYDRVVFEFEHGVPAFTLKQATPPLTEDASGRELDVDGSSFWQLVMRDATRAGMDGEPAFTDTDFHPDFPMLAELIEGGDFEAVSTWYFGLEAEACVRVLDLDGPSRLVFDIQH
ncbi:MAG TPA: hypothetical protein VFJ03_01390 [Candidatus Limnocylindria bacterium]|nr:hypothetical protein [Candidatus Limnocylindria bacterium]